MPTMRKKIYKLSIAISAVAFFFVQAKIGNGAILHDYYGGKIKAVTYCTCYYDFGIVLEIEDYSRNRQTIKVFYNPLLSRLRANYNIWYMGPYVIGGYTMMPKTCRNTSGFTCSDSSTKADGIVDFIRGIGSSFMIGF